MATNTKVSIAETSTALTTIGGKAFSLLIINNGTRDIHVAFGVPATTSHLPIKALGGSWEPLERFVFSNRGVVFNAISIGGINADIHVVGG